MLRVFVLLLVLSWSLPLTAAPRVVASIAPIHSLVAGVMEGVGEPTLLIPANASPHAYALKPSDARALSKADLVVWVGKDLEMVLEQPMQTLAGNARALELSALADIRLLPAREGGVWGKGGHDEEHEHGHGAMDTHLWLDPENARVIVDAVAGELAALDAKHAELYQANAKMMKKRISDLGADITKELAPFRERPYIVFHDAYHYFEDAFSLHPVGAISVSPDRSPGARRLSEIRKVIRERGAVCVFSEPQFRPATVSVVLEGTGARNGVLDPLGATLTPGKELWFQLMRALAGNLRACMEP
jgi:zinc transport system substrate-binding protein